MEGGGSASLGAEREGALAGPSGLLHPFQGPSFLLCASNSILHLV